MGLDRKRYVQRQSFELLRRIFLRCRRGFLVVLALDLKRLHHLADIEGWTGARLGSPDDVQKVRIAHLRLLFLGRSVHSHHLLFIGGFLSLRGYERRERLLEETLEAFHPNALLGLRLFFHHRFWLFLFNLGTRPRSETKLREYARGAFLGIFDQGLGLLDRILPRDESQIREKSPLVFGRGLLDLIGDGNGLLRFGYHRVEFGKEFVIVGDFLKFGELFRGFGWFAGFRFVTAEEAAEKSTTAAAIFLLFPFSFLPALTTFLLPRLPFFLVTGLARHRFCCRRGRIDRWKRLRGRLPLALPRDRIKVVHVSGRLGIEVGGPIAFDGEGLGVGCIESRRCGDAVIVDGGTLREGRRGEAD
mmetsp:Transcript_4432/g.7912  ORF Transcript_4432/g.7912 Transcript_4432/m.7912 type:complete len:360 (+) Transcript_4432:1072-2151(+)